MRTPNANSTPFAVSASRFLSLGAAMILTAHAEHALAVAVGIDPILAWLFPICLDLYAAAAFRAHARPDIGAAIGLMIACQTLAHLLTAGMIAPSWWLVIPVSAVVPVVLWRGHHLGTITPPAAEAEPVPVAAPAVPQPVPVAVPVAVAPVVTPARQAPRPVRKSRNERLADLANLITARPDITQGAAAKHMGVTDRYVRGLFDGSWAAHKTAILA